MHEAISHYNFADLEAKTCFLVKVVKKIFPKNAYIELVEKLKPIVKSLMFGEACSNVPIFKN